MQGGRTGVADFVGEACGRNGLTHGSTGGEARGGGRDEDGPRGVAGAGGEVLLDFVLSQCALVDRGQVQATVPGASASGFVTDH